MKSVGKYRCKSGWLVIDVDPEIGHYYRHLFSLYHHRCKRLRNPTWDAHISVIYNHIDIPFVDASKYDGIDVEFEYGVDANTNDVHVWLPVQCNHALEVRKEFGLSEPLYPLHLTIGNNKNV